GVDKHIAFRLQLHILIRRQIRLFNLGDLEIYDVQSLQALRLALSELFQLPGYALQIIISLRHAGAIFRSPGKSVEKIEMDLGQQQALLISVAVYINQMRMYVLQQSDIVDLIIDNYLSSSIVHQFASD